MNKIMPKQEGPANRRVAALLYDGLCSFEFGISAEVFALQRPELGVHWYEFTTVAEELRPLRTTGGVAVIAEEPLEALAGAGTIVIPGWRTDGVAPSARLAEAIGQAHARGARLVTICSGVFLLAALGLLGNRRVTTHWLYADRLRALHPEIIVDASVLYVDEGDILTSAGSAAGIDLLLHLVRKDFGAAIANQVARRMVVPPHREGDQAQFIEQPMPKNREGRLSRLLDLIQGNLAESWTISRMAREAAMSERTFIRRFHDSLGYAPGEWLIRLRTERARQLLEVDGTSLGEVAERTGFGSVAALRQQFRNRLGVTPARYRALHYGG